MFLTKRLSKFALGTWIYLGEVDIQKSFTNPQALRLKIEPKTSDSLTLVSVLLSGSCECGFQKVLIKGSKGR